MQLQSQGLSAVKTCTCAVVCCWRLLKVCWSRLTRRLCRRSIFRTECSPWKDRLLIFRIRLLLRSSVCKARDVLNARRAMLRSSVCKARDVQCLQGSWRVKRSPSYAEIECLQGSWRRVSARLVTYSVCKARDVLNARRAMRRILLCLSDNDSRLINGLNADDGICKIQTQISVSLIVHNASIELFTLNNYIFFQFSDYRP